MSGADFANMFAGAMGGGQPQRQQPQSMDAFIQQAMGAMAGGAPGGGGQDMMYNIRAD